MKVKVTRGRKVKTVFANNSVQNCRKELPQNLAYSILLSNSKYNYGPRTVRKSQSGDITMK